MADAAELALLLKAEDQASPVLNKLGNTIDQVAGKTSGSYVPSANAAGVSTIALGNIAAMAAVKVMELGQEMARAATESINYADDISDTAIAVGMSTDEVQKFGYALKMEGLPLSSLTMMTRYMSSAMEQAAKSQDSASVAGEKAGDAFEKATEAEKKAVDNLNKLRDSGQDTSAALLKVKAAKEATAEAGDRLAASTAQTTDTFSRLNIDLDAFKGMSTAEQMDTLFTALSNVSSANERMVLTNRLFGVSGQTLLPMIQSWTSQQDKLNQMLKDFGIPEDKIKSMGELKAEMEAFGIAQQYAAMTMTADLQPALKVLIPEVSKLVKAFADMVVQNPGAIQALTDLASGILKIAEAFIAVMNWWNSLPAPLRAILGGGTPSTSMAIAEMYSGTGGGVAGSKEAEEAAKSMIGAEAVAALAPGEAEEMERQREWWRRTYGTEPSFGSGGIVMGPTRALIGESGPEAIIPLSNMGGGIGGGTNLTIHIGSYMGDDMSLRKFTREIQRVLEEENRRSTTKRSSTEYYSAGGHL